MSVRGTLLWAFLIAPAGGFDIPQAEPGGPVATPGALLAEARAYFARREDTANLKRAIEALEQALEAINREPGMEPDVRVELARYYHNFGEYHAAGSKAKSSLFLRGIEHAEKAAASGSVGGHYWKAANLGSWGEFHGVGFLSRRGEFMAALEQVMRLDRSYDYWGADRMLAAYHLPRAGGLWGDREKALAHTETAVSNAPGMLWNRKIRADLYERLGDKAKALEVRRSILDFDLAQQPELAFENSRIQERVAASLSSATTEEGE